MPDPSTTPTGDAPIQRESFLALRRCDGEPIWGEYAWVDASGPNMWEAAETETEGDWDEADATSFELVRMHVETVEVRRYRAGRHVTEEIPDV